jgi:hypothetical protein
MQLKLAVARTAFKISFTGGHMELDTKAPVAAAAPPAALVVVITAVD